MDREWRLVDIARHLGVSKQRAHQLYTEGCLPAPAGEDVRGRYWNAADIHAWAVPWAAERHWRGTWGGHELEGRTR